MSKQDRLGARTPAQLEQKYAFEKRMNEAMAAADEAKRVASSITETNSGLSLKVQALDKDLNGEDGVKAQLDLKVGVDAEGNLQSKMHIGADLLTIDTDNFSLTEKGEITANKGTIAGWKIDAFGIHQANGIYGTYEITEYSGVTETRTITGYMFYCLQSNGLYRYIFEENNFFPYSADGTLYYLWAGELSGNYTIKRTA